MADSMIADERWRMAGKSLPPPTLGISRSLVQSDLGGVQFHQSEFLCSMILY